MGKLLIFSSSSPPSYTKSTYIAALTAFYPTEVQSNHIIYSKPFCGIMHENTVNQIQTWKENNSGLTTASTSCKPLAYISEESLANIEVHRTALNVY